MRKINLFFLKGTDEERGIKKWRQHEKDESTSGEESDMRIYDIPFIQKYLNKSKICRYLPFCPTFSLGSKCKQGHKDDIEAHMTGTQNNGQSESQDIKIRNLTPEENTQL